MTQFTVKRIAVVHYQVSYSREEVLDLMSLSDIDACPNSDIRAKYENLTDEELRQAFLAQLQRRNNATTARVSEDAGRHANVQRNTCNFSVQLEA